MLDEHAERVGFYNTFVGRIGQTGRSPLPAGVSVEADPETGDVHLLRGPHFRGIQFHAESILTEHGSRLVQGLVGDLLVQQASLRRGTVSP
jgi:phenazine biosynthesis protein phzE